MKDHRMEHRNESSAVVPVAASGISMAIGCLVLAGWAFDLDFLKRIVPGAVAMNPVTAVCLTLLAVTLALLRKEDSGQTSRRISRACASLVVLVALVKLLEFVFGWEFGIDQLLFAEKLQRDSAATGVSSRMSPNGVFDFLLLGCAALLLDVRTRRDRRPAEYLILVGATASLFALVGYAYGVEQFYGVFSYVPMAVHTGLTFVALSIGFLYARPDRGFMKVFTGDGTGGLVARRLLPAAILLPVALGWLVLEGRRMGLYDTLFGLILFATSMMLTFAILVGWSALQLDRTDARRRRGEEALRRSEREHRAVISNLPDAAIIVFDHDLRFTLVEGPAMWRLGWKRAEIEGRSIHESLPPESQSPGVHTRKGARRRATVFRVVLDPRRPRLLGRGGPIERR